MVLAALGLLLHGPGALRQVHLRLLLLALLGNEKSKGVKNKFNEEVIPAGKKFTEKTLQVLNFLDIIPISDVARYGPCGHQ